MDLRDLEKAYVASLPDVSLVNTLPVKALRFIITATVGAIDPVISIVIGSIDGFFVEMWLTGYAPKLFIDEMKNLTSGYPLTHTVMRLAVATGRKLHARRTSELVIRQLIDTVPFRNLSPDIV